MPAKNKQNRKKAKPIGKSSKIIDLDVVNEANSQINPFDQLPSFRSFSRNGLSVNFTCNNVASLDKPTIEWAFDLLSRNMQSLYETSAWGWNKKEKFNEMTEDNARYLIAYDASEKPVAFSHFRFDMDYDIPVLYCYEMQLEVECRRKGLGRFMLQILELLAFKANLTKVVLTVFLHNPDSIKFFKSLG